jgi:hypothetical protein
MNNEEHLRRIHTYHAVRLSCHSAKGLDLSFPFDLHSAVVFDSHVSCRSPAMQRICHSESDLSRPRQVRGRGRHGVCELPSAVQRLHVGDLPAFGTVGEW